MASRSGQRKIRKGRRRRPAPKGGASPPAGAPAVPGPAGAEGLGFTRRGVLAAAALCLLVGVSYFPAFLAGFVWDDEAFTDAAVVRDVSGLWRIWFSPRAIENEGHYWPLVYTTFWLEHKLWGFAPAGYHAVNVALHAVNTLLLWRLAERLAVPGAWLAAAVFGVHPLHVESVAWVIERKDLLSGLFYLAAFLTWVRFTEEPRPEPRRRRRLPEGRYLAAMALFVCALLSKSIAVTLPAALLIRHWWKQGRVTAPDLLRLAPFFAVGLAAAVADVSFYNVREPLDLGYSPVERLLIAAHALWFYAGKLLWPAGLAVIYPHWEVSAADPAAWGYAAAGGAAAAALWFLRHRAGRGPLAGLLFFAVTLSPVLGFVDYGYMQFSFVADRYQYLAGIGVTAVLVGAAAHGTRRLPEGWRKGAAGAAAAVLLVLGVLTWRQAEVYRDEGDLLHPRRVAQSRRAGRARQSRQRPARNAAPGGGAGRISHRGGTGPERRQGARPTPAPRSSGWAGSARRRNGCAAPWSSIRTIPSPSRTWRSRSGSRGGSRKRSTTIAPRWRRMPGIPCLTPAWATPCSASGATRSPSGASNGRSPWRRPWSRLGRCAARC